jgi:hypothetical protein
MSQTLYVCKEFESASDGGIKTTTNRLCMAVDLVVNDETKV